MDSRATSRQATAAHVMEQFFAGHSLRVFFACILITLNSSSSSTKGDNSQQCTRSSPRTSRIRILEALSVIPHRSMADEELVIFD